MDLVRFSNVKKTGIWTVCFLNRVYLPPESFNIVVGVSLCITIGCNCYFFFLLKRVRATS